MRQSFLVLCLMAGLGYPAAAAAAAPKHQKKTEVDPAVPAKLEAKLTLTPKSLRFGMTPKQVAREYAKLIDRDYLKRFQATNPGIEQQRLEIEVEQKKALFRRGKIDFGDLPTGLDGSPLSGEFSYRNREAMMQLTRRGKKRMLFFIRGKLWKLFDVYTLGPKTRWGADFKTAVARLEKRLGTEGRLRPADPSSGLRHEEVDWASSGIRLRAINWGKSLAISYVEQRTENRIDSLRTTTAKKKDTLDDTVRDALR